VSPKVDSSEQMDSPGRNPAGTPTVANMVCPRCSRMLGDPHKVCCPVSLGLQAWQRHVPGEGWEVLYV
jgi:hypothetical protein